MMGSDYPLNMGAADPVAHVRLAGLDAMVEAGVLGGNARRFLAPEPAASGGSGRRSSRVSARLAVVIVATLRNLVADVWQATCKFRGAMPKKMYIVSRAKPELHERLSTYFAADDATKVVSIADRASAVDRRRPRRVGAAVT